MTSSSSGAKDNWTIVLHSCEFWKPVSSAIVRHLETIHMTWVFMKRIHFWSIWSLSHISLATKNNKIRHCWKITQLTAYSWRKPIIFAVIFYRGSQTSTKKQNKTKQNKEIQRCAVIPVPGLPHKPSQQKAQAKADYWVERSNYP